MKGTVFWKDDCNNGHFWFIISDKISKEYGILVVNITTIYPKVKFDEISVVNIGEHPCVKNNSYIRYKNAKN